MTRRDPKAHSQVAQVVRDGAEVRPRLRVMRDGHQVITCTLDIMAFFGRDRHDPILAAVYKVEGSHSPEFVAANLFRSEYKTGRGQWKPCYWVTRAGLEAICRHLEKTRETLPVYLEAFDKAKGRLDAAGIHPETPAPEPEPQPEPEPEMPPDLDPDTIPEDTGLDPEPEPEPEPVSGGAVQPFMFDDPDGKFTVRAVDQDGETWFVASDVCKVLDIVDEKQAVDRLEADERGGCIVPTSGGPQTVRAVNEAGLYSLILTSRKPAAKRFKRWVTHDVLPQIRRTGRYEPDGVKRYGSLDDLMADPAGLMTLTLSYAGQIKEQKAEILTLEAQVSVLEPKAAALDRLADKAGTMNLRSAAKALGFGPDWFKTRLEQLDYLYREDGRLVAYQKHIDAGLFVHKPVVLSHRDGTEYVVSQPLVTARGLARLAVAFGVGVRAVLGQGVLGLRRDRPSEGEAWH